MPTRPTIVIAGAGIGGLTAALALARREFRVVVLERSSRLEETGAGIQLSPNASGVLLDLGLGKLLEPDVVAPEAIRIMRADGAEIVRVPLGSPVKLRFGSPYWVIHRADLQKALLTAVAQRPEITLRLDARVQDYAEHARGLTVTATVQGQDLDEHGAALVGADGLWSTVAQRLWAKRRPRFAGRTAWRAVVPQETLPADLRASMTHLWLGNDAHVVHYPIKAGRLVNIVAIVHDNWQEIGWSTLGEKQALLSRFGQWCPPLQELLDLPERWLKWALFRKRPMRRWGRGKVTLLGDAAHPMLPFLAQGGAMAIEDAAVLAECLSRGGEVEPALRSYEGLRRARTARVQSEANRNDLTYHLGGPAALARDTVLRLMGGQRLLSRYDWLYDWRLPRR